MDYSDRIEERSGFHSKEWKETLKGMTLIAEYYLSGGKTRIVFCSVEEVSEGQEW